jgi:hypothetical protein
LPTWSAAMARSSAWNGLTQRRKDVKEDMTNATAIVR